MPLRELIQRVNPMVAIAVFCGGLGGSVFTWYVNRPTPVVLAYVISTTTTGADPGVQSLLPKLTLRLGDEPISAINTHAIDIIPTQGYAAEASIGIFFAGKPRIFGNSIEPPSPLHQGQCEPLSPGLRCVLMPVDSRQSVPYRIRIATDTSQPPRLSTTDRGIELLTLQDAANRQPLNRLAAILLYVVISVLVIWVILLISDTIRMQLNPNATPYFSMSIEKQIALARKQAEKQVEIAQKNIEQLEARLPKPHK
jgi:hypothetical protein